MYDVIVSQVVNRLSHFIEEWKKLDRETGDFETLQQDMTTIQGLLLRVHTGTGKDTMRKLRIDILTERLDSVAFQIADLLELLTLSVGQESHWKKVRSFIHCSCFRLPRSRESGPIYDFAREIYRCSKKFSRLLMETEEITSNSRLHLNKTEFRPHAENDQSSGRESDKISVLGHLLVETSKQVEMISVVGFLGSGKTTLARSLFDDDRVEKHFDIRCWTNVSNVFDETSIATRLLVSLGAHEYTGELEFELLEEYFSGKKVFLVFDDVWTEDVRKWEPLKNSLRKSAPGSKILVTTRSQRVACAACSDFVHRLGPLTYMDCWLLISKGIESKGKAQIPKEMMKIGKKLAKHCKGSPLIAKIVGMELLDSHTPQEWQRVLDTGIWRMEEVATSIFTQFYMTYEELSPESRLCFWYCAVFPIDHVINVDQLIRLWTAEGYFGYQTDDKVIEAKAIECFEELANHCLFQDLAKDSIHKDKITSCKIQGVAHEFIISTVSRYEVKLLRCYLSFSNRKVPKDNFSVMKRLRALVLSSRHLEQLPKEAEDLNLLQYLDLSCNPLKELPATICKLPSLQFLDVSFCYLLSQLPQQICEVKSLKHLRVNCTTDELHVLPQGFENLTLIRTLDVVRIGGKYDSNVQKLRGLNRLEDIRIAVHGKVNFLDADFEMKSEMENLELCFIGDGRDPEKAQCIEKLVPPPNLKMLKIEDYPGPRLPNWILDQSMIHSLRRLSVRSGSNISSLPSLWKLSCLEFLWLYNIPSLKRLGCEFFGFPKTMQQRSLKENKNKWSYPMSKDDEERESDDSEDDEEIGCDGTAFPRLKTLRIEYMQNWETWEDLDVDEADERRINVTPSLEEIIITEDEDEEVKIKVLPSLEELIISACPLLKLKALPNRVLGKISSLKIQVDGHQVKIPGSKEASASTGKVRQPRLKPRRVRKQRSLKSQKLNASKF